jgi:hypothetical protein
MPQPLYPRGIEVTIRTEQESLGPTGGLLALQTRIETRSLGRPARSLISVAIEVLN